MSHDICGLTGCNKKHYAQGLCGPHYKRLWAYGTTEDQPKDSEARKLIPAEAVDPVVAYLNAHFRPDVAADLLAAAQPLLAIAWDEGWDAFAGFDSRPGGPYPANPYRSGNE